MTVQELINELSDYGPDMEVRLAQQPNYPIQCGVGGVAAAETDDKTCVYIMEGSSKGYGPSDLWR